MVRLSSERMLEELAKIKAWIELAEENVKCGYLANFNDNLVDIRRRVDYLLDCDWEV